MRKNFTYLNSVSSHIQNAASDNLPGPGKECIDNILKFAASYRAERCSEGGYVEYLLN